MAATPRRADACCSQVTSAPPICSCCPIRSLQSRHIVHATCTHPIAASDPLLKAFPLRYYNKLCCRLHLLRCCTCAFLTVQLVLKYCLVSGNNLDAVVGGAGGEGVNDSGNVVYSGNNNSGDFSRHGGIAMGTAGNALGGGSLHLCSNSCCMDSTSHACSRIEMSQAWVCVLSHTHLFTNGRNTTVVPFPIPLYCCVLPP